MTLRRLLLLLATVFPGAFLVGCESRQDILSSSRDAQSVLSPASIASDARTDVGGFHFYPLDLGNRWHWSHVFQFDIVQGGQPGSGSPYIVHSDIRSVLIGIEHRNDKDYVVEHQVIQEEDLTDPIHYWIRYRQDRTGLYEADVVLGEPPILTDSITAPAVRTSHGYRPDSAAPLAGVRGGPNAESYWASWNRLQRKVAIFHAGFRVAHPWNTSEGFVPDQPDSNGELTRFPYPLRPGLTWAIRQDDPTFVSSLEAIEVLRLPAGRFTAYRIRNTFQGMGEKDSILIWYSREGMLRFAAHFEDEARDAEGNPIGTLISDETQVLEDFQLVGGHAPASLRADARLR